MALLAARRAAALLRQAPATALLRPAAARFSSRPDYRAFVACLRDISESVQADKNYFTPASAAAEKNYFTPATADSFREKAESIRAANHDGQVLRVIHDVIRSQHRGLLAMSSYWSLTAKMQTIGHQVVEFPHKLNYVWQLNSSESPCCIAAPLLHMYDSKRTGIAREVEGISSDFPFEISEKEGLTGITLTRSLKGEQIEVLVSTPKLDQDEEGDKDHSNSSSSSSNDNPQDKGKDHSNSSSSSSNVRVTVSKADGSGLVFTCTANPDDIVIKSLSIRRKLLGAEEGDAFTYDEGPDFCELDKNLQETFHKYLELRGITPTTTKLLHKYMITKDTGVLPKSASKDNLVFLTKLSNFVKKD